MCGRKDFMLVAKKVPLCCDHNRKIIKYELFYYSVTHGKTTSLYIYKKKELMTFNKMWEHKHFFSQTLFKREIRWF
jgi:hypothetical protein